MTPSPDVQGDVATVVAPSSRNSNPLPWLGLFIVFGLYAALVASLQPTNFFGLTEDDSQYMSSGKALASGQGYIQANLPGAPPATKYPILYPWLMSVVWRWAPSFPENLRFAIGFNVACGFAFLAIAFAYLRRILRLSDPGCLIVTALCALHPAMLFYTANVLSEIPFAALSLGAMALATTATTGKRQNLARAGAGALSGLALLMRSLGAPIALGLFLATTVRSGWRKSVYFVAGVFPFAAISLWRSAHMSAASVPDAAAPCTNVVRMSWLYYTSYVAFWKVDVLRGSGLWHVLSQNVLLLLLQPGTYLVDPLSVRPSVVALAPAVILSAAAIRGLAPRFSGTKWQPVHFALLLYAIPLMLWNYGVMERFLLPFLPLFIAGIWLECKALLRRIIAAARQPGPRRETGAAVFLCVALLAMAWCVSWSYWSDISRIRDKSESRRAILSDKREAYAWLAANSAPSSKVIAYEDATLYLYSNRQAIRPVIFSPAGTVRAERLNAELACMTGMSEAVGASYWIVADDDFGYEWEPAITLGRRREAEFETAWPRVFGSSKGMVRVYRVAASAQPMAGISWGDSH
jgi:hypothetical protein